MLNHDKSESFTVLFVVGIGTKFSSCTSFSVGHKSNWTRYIITNIIPQINKNTVNLSQHIQKLQVRFIVTRLVQIDMFYIVVINASFCLHCSIDLSGNSVQKFKSLFMISIRVVIL